MNKSKNAHSIVVTLITAALALISGQAQAQVLVPQSFTGQFVETFEYLGPNGTSSGPHWRVNVSGNSDLIPRSSADGVENGSSRNAGLNAGASGSTNRALGIYAGAVGDERHITTAFTNNSLTAIDKLTIQYDFILVASRINNALRFAELKLEISLDGSRWTSMGNEFNAVLDNRDVTVNSNYWIEQPKLLSDVGGIYFLETPVELGSTFFLRWNGRAGGGAPTGYNNGQRRNTGSAIDNVRISSNGYSLLAADMSPIPEPGSALFIGLTITWFVINRRRRPCSTLNRPIHSGINQSRL